MTRTITPTHVLLNQITLAASASSVTFSNIPQTFGDLIITFSGTLSADSPVFLTYNADTSGYTRTHMLANGSGASSASGSDGRVLELGNTESNFISHIMDYSATDKHKTVVTRSNDANGAVYVGASRWANTSAIVSILVDPDSTTELSSGAVISLYGVHA